MSESKIESFQKKCLQTSMVHVIGPLELCPEAYDKKATILAVDGGVEHLETYDLSVGDGDSASKKLDIILSPDKDLSDLSFALGLIPPHCQVSLFGFWGQRLDHQLTVLGELAQWSHGRTFGPTLHSPSGEKIIYYPAGTHQLFYKGLFSLLSLFEGDFSLEGEIKYPLPQKRLPPLSSHLLSNQGKGAFELKSSVPLFIFYGAPL